MLLRTFLRLSAFFSGRVIGLKRLGFCVIAAITPHSDKVRSETDLLKYLRDAA
jgi:hypothetical protein